MAASRNYLAVFALVLASACGDDVASAGAHAAGDAGNARDAGDASSSDAGRNPGKLDCLPALSREYTTISDPDQAYVSGPTFVWSGDGIVGVWQGPEGHGYRVIELDADGAPRAALRTVWKDALSTPSPRIAVSADVLAIVDQAAEGDNQRPTCRLGLVRLGGKDSLAAPARFSDPTEDDSVLNEAQHCDVVAVGGDFVLVWQQIVSRTTALATRLFAQRVGRDGVAQGARLTIASTDDEKLLGPVLVTSDATRALVVHALGGQGGTSLAFIEGDQVHSVASDLDAPIERFIPAHDGFLAVAGDALWTFDREGKRTHGPIDIASASLIAPLGSAYVAVSHEEFLIARTFDATLANQSDAVGISDSRGAYGEAIIYAADGSSTALLYDDAGEVRLAKLQCGDEPAAPPGPAACPAKGDMQPLDDGCEGPVCHVAIRLDYLTLGLRGWSMASGPAESVDAEAASGIADDAFEMSGQTYLSSGTQVSGPEAGLFTALRPAGDFGAFALIGEQSGAVIAAGGVVWSGHGDYWLPESWNPAADIACGEAAAVPAETHLDPNSCVLDEGMHPPTAREAMDVALRSNLAAHIAAQGPFQAFAYLYTPTVGACDPGAAEYLIVLSQARQ
jgi:hypothetical protein